MHIFWIKSYKEMQLKMTKYITEGPGAGIRICESTSPVPLQVAAEIALRVPEAKAKREKLNFPVHSEYMTQSNWNQPFLIRKRKCCRGFTKRSPPRDTSGISTGFFLWVPTMWADGIALKLILFPEILRAAEQVTWLRLAEFSPSGLIAGKKNSAKLMTFVLLRDKHPFWKSFLYATPVPTMQQIRPPILCVGVEIGNWFLGNLRDTLRNSRALGKVIWKTADLKEWWTACPSGNTP